MSESLKFKIGLSGTYWDRPPQYKILVSGRECASGSITGESDVVQHIEFQVDMEDGDQTLEIQLVNKEFSDVLKNDDNSIAKDQLLNIESIEVDDIDMGNLKYSASSYYPFEKQVYDGKIIDKLDNCVNLGWNGSYKLPFSSPFYIWLLENL